MADMRNINDRRPKSVDSNLTWQILHGNLLRAILTLSIPIMMNNFLQTMYNLTDTFWLGKIGTTSMAAISLVTPVQNIIVNFGQGITVGGSILISQYIGAGDRKNARHIANQVFICAITFALLCSLVCFLCTPLIVKRLGAEGEVFEFGKIYLGTVVFNIPFLFTNNIFSAVRQSQGDTVTPMLLNLLGILINMVLDPLLMIGFHLGIRGAALATLFSTMPPAFICLKLLTNKRRAIHLTPRLMRFNKKMVKRVITIGLPSSLGGSIMQLGFLLMTTNVLEYGDAAMAAYGIGNKINGLISMPSTAMGGATATIVGQNVGAMQLKRAERAYKMARNLMVMFLFTGGMILSRSFVSVPIVSIFTTDSEVIPMASKFLATMAFWCWTNGIHDMTMGLLNGTGKTFITMIISIVRLWGFRFLTLFICETVLKLGVDSIWYSVVVSNGISSLILYILYKSRIWAKDARKI